MSYPFKKSPTMESLADLDVGGESGIELEDGYRPQHDSVKTDEQIKQDLDYAIEILMRLWALNGDTVHDSGSAIIEEALTKLNVVHSVKTR